MKEENSDNQLKDFFKGKFADEYLTPPKGAWSNIKGQMATPSRIRKPMYYWLIPVGLLFIIGGGIAVNSFISTEKAQTSSVSTEEKNEIQNRTQEDLKVSDKVESSGETKENESDEIEVESVSVDEKLTENMDAKEDAKLSNTTSNSLQSNTNKSRIPSSRQSDSKKTLTNKVSNEGKSTSSVLPAKKESKAEQTDNRLKTVVKANRSEEIVTTGKEKIVDLTSTQSGGKEMKTESTKKVLNEEFVLVDENNEEIKSGKSEIESEKVNKKNNTKNAEVITSNDQTEEQITAETSVVKSSEKPVKKEIAQENKQKETKENKKSEVDSLSISQEKVPTPEPKPEVVESNILLKSVAPRNNLRYDFYMGLGKSTRNSTFYETDQNDTTLLLANKKMNMNNTVMGFNVRYQITPYFAMRSGIALGSDRYRTQQFVVKLANTDLDNNIRLATSNGILQTNGLQNGGLTANGADSSIYNMQIFHRQGYVTIPISFVVNTKIQPGKLYYYGCTGFDFMAKGKGRNLLTINDGEQSQDISLFRITDVNKLYTNWNLALGLAYPFQSRFDLFTEFNYSLDVSKRLNNSYLNTSSSYVQVLIGLRF